MREFIFIIDRTNSALGKDVSKSILEATKQALKVVKKKDNFAILLLGYPAKGTSSMLAGTKEMKKKVLKDLKAASNGGGSDLTSTIGKARGMFHTYNGIIITITDGVVI